MPDWLTASVTLGAYRRVDYGMRNSLVLASIVLVSATATSCKSTGPVNEPEFRHAVSLPQCGPADGPATAVLMARYPFEGIEPGNPYVRVLILRAAADLPGTTWHVGSITDDAGALYYSASGDPEQVTSGTVRITTVVPQQRVEGSVDLQFPSRRVNEDFSAPWIEPLILCG